jgi:hypothetical protein
MTSTHSESPFPWRENLWNPGVRYGLFLGACMFLADHAFRPWGWAVFWTVLFVQMVVFELVVWRRLRLKYFAVGGLAGIFAAGTVSLYAWQGYQFVDIFARAPWPIVAALVGAFILTPLSIAIESRLKTDAWQAWAARTDRASLWSVLTFQHIPDLRAGRG